MKKILFISLVALAAAACCGPKCNKVCVDKVIANPAEFVGKEVTVVGKAVVTNVDAKRIAVFGSDSTKYIMVQGLDSAKVCQSMCGQAMQVCGTLVAVEEGVVVADSVANFAFVADKYFVAAKCISKAECCAKDGKKCCPKGEEKACCKKDAKKCCAKDSAQVKECPMKK
ncbi:MAG: hypothetical protein LBU92_01275 [Prevotellaceae bacterium]|nr:hypothetical protein [Prevotellaceae bacterium]